MLLMPLLLSALALQTSADVLFKTNDASIRIGGDGMMRSIADAAGREYSVVAKPSPVLSIRIKGEILAPDGMTWDATTGTMRLQYRSAGVVAKLRVLNKHTHLTFELVDLRPKKDVELVLWGPYQTTIGKIVGETVGVGRPERLHRQTAQATPFPRRTVLLQRRARDPCFRRRSLQSWDRDLL